MKIAEIIESNEEFDNAKRSQKRVMIAKDIQKMLLAKALVAERGVYVKPLSGEEFAIGTTVDYFEDVHKFDFDGRGEKGVHCACCMKGAAVLATIGRNKCDVEFDKANTIAEAEDSYDLDYFDDCGVFNIFPPSMWKAMETAFEGWEHKTSNKYLLKFIKNTKGWNDSQIMMAICDIIISNDGHLKNYKGYSESGYPELN